MTPDLIRLERGSLLALLDEAVVLARHMVPKLYLGLALPSALAAGAVTGYQSLVMRNVLSIIPVPDTTALSNIFSNFAFFILLIFGYIAVISLSSAGIFAAAAAELDGRPIGVLQAYLKVLQPRVLGTLFLMTLLVVLGFFFCVLPGIYLGLVWGLFLPVIFLEKSYGFQALSRSRQLIIHDPNKSLFTPGMGWMLLIGITVLVLSYGASIAVQLPLMAAQQFFMLRHIMGQAENAAANNPLAFLPSWFFILQAVSAFLSTLVQMLVAFFSGSAVNLLYLRLRGRKEGHDLMAALDRLGAPE